MTEQAINIRFLIILKSSVYESAYCRSSLSESERKENLDRARKLGRPLYEIVRRVLRCDYILNSSEEELLTNEVIKNAKTCISGEQIRILTAGVASQYIRFKKEYGIDLSSLITEEHNKYVNLISKRLGHIEHDSSYIAEITSVSIDDCSNILGNEIDNLKFSLNHN